MKREMSRRTVLRGMGSMIALPWMEAMRPARTLMAAASATSGATVTSGPARRLAFLFVPNGAVLPHWTPKSEGYRYDLPSILEPLHTVRDDVMVLTGLTNDKGRANGDGAGDHARSASTFLTGCQPYKSSSVLRSGISADQLAAQTVGDATRFPSWELGCERNRATGSCDSGYGCAYSHHISWSSASVPVAKEVDPRRAFERLFGAREDRQDRRAFQQRIAKQQSVLDAVREDARSLQRRLGVQDHQKLDEYFTAVRGIERRLELASRETKVPQESTGYPVPTGVPDDFGAYVRIMLDLIVLAFQTDQTRIASCMFGIAGSNRVYREIEIRTGHHQLSHHGRNPEKLDKLRQINRYHMQHFAYFLQRLKSVSDGDGTLLDHSMIVYGSGLSDGNRHNNENLPIVLAGHGGGTLRSGRHLVYPQETPLANLHVALLQRAGVEVDHFGDSTGALTGLG